MNRRPLTLCAIPAAIALSLFVTGCNHGAPGAGTPAPTGPITIKFVEPPKILAAVPVEVDVYPVPDAPATVTLSLTMAGMTMPKNSIVLKSEGNGDYSGQCVFTMSGKWVATATVATASKIDEDSVPVTVP